MTSNAAHNKWWQIFEAVFGIPFLIAIILQMIVPVSFRIDFNRIIFILGGTALIILGTALVILARRQLVQQGQPTDPGFPTSMIVTTGVFSISRNPLYLGGVFILVGIGIAANLPWVLALLIPALVSCHYVLIAPEERYLTAKFGYEYTMYCATVHRWIGRKRNPSSK